MAKKRRDKAPETEAKSAIPGAPERIASPFKDALAPLKKELIEQQKAAEAERAARAEAAKKPPAPVTPKLKPKRGGAKGQLEEDEATALSLAMQGVVPLNDKKVGRVANAPLVQSRTAKVAPFGSSAEDKARERLEALVAQDIRFRIEVDQNRVEGMRADAQPRVLRELARRTRASETLDLHGKNSREAREEIVSFVRKMHRRGLDVLCIVHGKGQHSEGGQGVLRDVVITALTESGAAPLVLAFVSAPDALGGSGALLVELKR